MNTDARTTASQTEQILQNHLDAAERGSVDAIVADYAEDAIFFTPDGILYGRNEIRGLFEELLPALPPPSTFDMKQRLIDGDVAYIVWSGESEILEISFATDTLIVRDGKIAMQTFAAQMEEKAAV